MCKGWGFKVFRRASVQMRGNTLNKTAVIEKILMNSHKVYRFNKIYRIIVNKT